MDAIPAPIAYNPPSGPARSIIVMPVPSGVIIAERMTKVKTACRQFCLQNVAGMILSEVSITINIGSRKNMPVANMNMTTVETKASMEKYGTMPATAVYA
jgi:hypothetical protein